MFLSIASMTISFQLGYTTIFQLLYAFGIPLWGLVVASGAVGYAKMKQSKKDVAHLRDALDMFQRGAYLETIKFLNVVDLANTRWGSDLDEPFELWDYQRTLDAIQQLEKTGYNIKVDMTNEEIRFDPYPKPDFPH